MPKYLYPITERGKTGYINRRGEVVIDPVYTNGTRFQGGLAQLKEGSKWGFIDTNGDWRIEPQFAMAAPFVGRHAMATNASNHPGIINRRGDWVVPPKSRRRIEYLSTNGLFAAQSENYKWGIMNLAGEWVAQPGRAFMVGEFVHGLAPARKTPSSRKYGFVDEGGHWRVPDIYSSASVFREGIAAVGLPNRGGQGYIAPNGKVVLRRKIGFGIGPGTYNGFYDGLARAADGKGAGFMDRGGKLVIACEHGVARHFSEGFAVVGKDYWHLGYIDKKGSWLVPPVLSGAAAFHGGLALVFPDPKRFSVGGYIDKKARWVWQPKKRFPTRFDDLRAK